MADPIGRGVESPNARVCGRAGRLARDGVVHEASEQMHVEQRARFARALQADRAPSQSPRAQGWIELLKAAAVAFLLCGAAAGAWSLWPRPPITYSLHGPNAAEGSYLEAEAEELRVTFSEGSELRLEPGASAQVAELTAQGARIVAHEGTVRARIEPQPDARWSVEAGPYVVRVTGTEFSVGWSTNEQRIVVELYEGAVVVTGPEVPAGLPLSAGHRLVASQTDATLLLTELGASPALREEAPRSADGIEPRATPAVEASPETAASPAPALPGPASASLKSWRQRVAEGEYASVVAEAEAEGIDAALERRSLEDLVALGDAARYLKRADLAPRILLAERQRFRESPHATTAAFLLGRLAERRGSAGEALGWYVRYRLEAPSGALAEEALGRVMQIQKRSGDREGARATAEHCVASYPSGGFARAAAQILEEP